MLIRETHSGSFECITQEQHAFVSGVLAGAWASTRLSPRLVLVNGIHDAPWREADLEPILNPETGRPHDFITFPMDEKVALYREGIDELEEIDPYAAFLVSRHYTSFSGTRDHEPLTAPEAQRRERLSELLPDASDTQLERAIEWIKFFDIFSLFICLTGPDAVPDAIPRWLEGTGWQTSPDDMNLDLTWVDDTELEVSDWPFGAQEVVVSLRMRILEESFDNQTSMRQAWDDCQPQLRRVVLRAS